MSTIGRRPPPVSEVEAAVVFVSGPGAELAAVAERVVEERLVACANLIPGVRSVYRWEGSVHRDDETLAVLKTTHEKLDALRDRVLDLHPYDVPEFLVLPVEMGSDSYLGWIADCVGDIEPDPET